MGRIAVVLFSVLPLRFISTEGKKKIAFGVRLGARVCVEWRLHKILSMEVPKTRKRKRKRPMLFEKSEEIGSRK